MDQQQGEQDPQNIINHRNATVEMIKEHLKRKRSLLTLNIRQRRQTRTKIIYYQRKNDEIDNKIERLRAEISELTNQLFQAETSM